jgi:hypothetical protein
MTSSYRWHCLACGHVNGVAGDACAACGCPSRATARQMADFREKYARAGGEIHPGAALDPGAVSIRALLLPRNRYLLWQMPFALYTFCGYLLFDYIPYWMALLWVIGEFILAFFVMRATFRAFFGRDPAAK